MNRDLLDLVAAHMMCSVTERYAILLKVGVPFDFLSRRLRLDGAPDMVAYMLLNNEGIVDWMGKEEGNACLERLMAEPLPVGITLPVR